tara:strand:+ start:37220 stop:38542 length:1323 start_codon:yes stop_codon:yes gene_type:complete
MRIPFTVIIVLLVIFSTSCRKGELIGREVQVGDSDILLLTTDSFHIDARTIEAEPERTDELFEGMLGAYDDPIFGSTVISYISQYHLEQQGFVFPTDAIFDSAFVSFRLTGGYRETGIDGRVRSMVHFQVYELAQDITQEEIYKSNENVKVKPAIIGEFEGLVGLFDTVYVGQDPQPSQIRIKMDDAWGEKMVHTDSNNYLTNESFTSFMKGLAVLPIQTNQANSNGVIFYFNPLSTFTNVTIHYHTDTDTTQFSFVPDDLTANFMTFKHDYANAPIQAVLDDTVAGSNQLFLQATIGTDVQIELSDIVSKFGSSPKVINYAELFIPVDTNQPYTPIAKLSVSRKLENGTAEFLPDQIQSGTRVIDGTFDADSARYRFLITQYVQEIIHNYTPGDVKSEVLLLSAFGNNTLANRSVVNGPRPNDPTAEKMKIVITYTPLN